MTDPEARCRGCPAPGWFELSSGCAQWIWWPYASCGSNSSRSTRRQSTNTQQLLNEGTGESPACPLPNSSGRPSYSNPCVVKQTMHEKHFSITWSITTASSSCPRVVVDKLIGIGSFFLLAFCGFGRVFMSVTDM